MASLFIPRLSRPSAHGSSAVRPTAVAANREAKASRRLAFRWWNVGFGGREVGGGANARSIVRISLCQFGAESKRLPGNFKPVDVEDAELPSRATVVDDGFDFSGVQVSLSQKLQVEVAATKRPHPRHSGMVDDDDDDDDDDGNNAGKENGMLVVLCSPMT